VVRIEGQLISGAVWWARACDGMGSDGEDVTKFVRCAGAETV